MTPTSLSPFPKHKEVTEKAEKTDGMGDDDALRATSEDPSDPSRSRFES